MKTLKKLFGIKTTYAIPSDNGVDITKGKKYKCKVDSNGFIHLKDNTKIWIVTKPENCLHVNNGSWEIITE